MRSSRNIALVSWAVLGFALAVLIVSPVLTALTPGLAPENRPDPVVVQAGLRPFTAGSELAVAASTLLTLALVQPMRRRIQAAVDRRFYRSRYDAARVVDAFATRMRDEVDLDAVQAEVLDVVGATLRPSHASVWLRGSAVTISGRPGATTTP